MAICPQCKADMSQTDVVCPKCGWDFPKKPDVYNYLPAALMLLIWCWPLAIPSIVYAAQIKPNLKNGDFDAALKASNTARFWCIIAFAAGSIPWLLMLLALLLNVLGVGATR